MTLWARLCDWFGWNDPAVVPRTPVRRRLRAECEYCGKDIAVIASTGRLWSHVCPKNAPIDEGDPNPFGQHDTWAEHRGER